MSINSMKSIITGSTIKVDFEEFIQEYYKAVIHSVCNAISTHKEDWYGNLEFN